MNARERAALRDEVARRRVERENVTIAAQRAEIRELRGQIARLEARLAAATATTDREGETELDWLTVGDVQRLLGVCSSSVRAWADSGRLPCFRINGGHRRFRRVDVEALREWRAA